MFFIALRQHVVFGLLTVIGAGLLTGCGQHGDGPAKAAAATDASLPPKEVHVAAARLEPWPITVRVQGSLLADEDAVIGSKLAGRVETVNVDLGSVVKRGEVMVALDQLELKLRVQQAEAMLRQACAAIGLTPDRDEAALVIENAPPVMLEQALVDEAKAAVARAERLMPTRAMTESEYDTYVAQLKTAQARYQSAINGVREQISLIGVRRADLALARQQLDDAQIFAPFDSLVDARSVSPGAYLQVGQAVVALVRIDRLRFTAGVPESQAGAIQVGQPIAIRVAGRDAPVPATISRVSPTVVQTSRSVRIEADVANPELDLQAGLFGEAEITVDPSATALAVPAAAVSQFAGVQKVWLVADGKCQQRTVRTGRREAGRIEILDGLSDGDVVVSRAGEGHEGPVVVADDAEAEHQARDSG
jgi:RND family efflux transporter MFP subunit